MRMLRFSRLSLLSQHERRGFRVSFRPDRTVIQAKNGFGKSAVLKSLYDVFGAEPYLIDRPWRSARVDTLLEFTVDGTGYAILSGPAGYAVFDADASVLLRTTSVSQGLTPFLARLFDFRLQMVDRREEVITPPPAYVFAPFYIDQDRGWKEPWDSFKGLYLNNSKQTLAEFHSGLKPNEYYAARTQRDLLQAQRRALETERHVLSQTLQGMQTLVSDVVLSYHLDDFMQESEQLLDESRELHADQLAYRQALADLAEERRLWLEQKDLVTAALREMDQNFADALDGPAEISCPTCGHHYINSIAEQFAIIEDKDGLFHSLALSTKKLHELEAKAEKQRGNIARIEERLGVIDRLLTARKEDITLRDVIAAEGRNEAGRVLRARLAEMDAGIGEKMGLERAEEERMKAAVSRKRTAEIKTFFFDRLAEFASELSVRLDTEKRLPMASMLLGRGSEGPRGIIAYFYAFLHTVRKYSTSTFCPIVIDAPNQHGQDDMPRIMRFLLDRQPAESQVIIATENLFGLTEEDAAIIPVGKRKNQLLDEDLYDEVSDTLRPYLGQLI